MISCKADENKIKYFQSKGKTPNSLKFGYFGVFSSELAEYDLSRIKILSWPVVALQSKKIIYISCFYFMNSNYI